MAIGHINGTLVGKLGNMVGQANKLVNGKDKQVWRQYQGKVANPKTVAQAQQRSLFVAVKNFQQAFKGILDHSFQGVEYGTRSLNHFRKLVLANGGAQYPNFTFQPKGSQDVVPQPWPLSRGSIATLGNMVSLGASGEELVISGLQAAPSTIDTATTIGEKWAEFLKTNPLLQNGDMITLCVVASADNLNNSVDINNTVCAAFVDRYIIDIDDNTEWELATLKTQNGIFSLSLFDDDANNEKWLQFVNTTINMTVVGIGVIISRQNGSKNSWLRSSADMVVLPQFANAINSNANITAALDSFMQAESDATSDWYLNETGSSSTSSSGSAASAVVRERALTIRTADGTRTVQAAYYASGSRNGYLYTDAGSTRAYYTVNGRMLTPVSLATGESFGSTDIISVSLVQSDLTAKGYTVSGSGSTGGDEQPE